MTDKEKLEMLNLRNRVSNQREQIKKLEERNDYLRCGIKQLEGILDAYSKDNVIVKTLYDDYKKYYWFKDMKVG